MSGLLFLTSEDFSVQRGQKDNILCHSIPGFSLILFYSTHCTYCQGLIPIFKNLPGSIGGCQFGMINVSNNRSCVQMSQDTNTPITYVPYIVLFINGKPFMSYKGPNDGEEIKRFIVEVANNIQKKQQFSRGQIKQENKEDSIPAYTIGHPVKGDDKVCYLEFTTAYHNSS